MEQHDLINPKEFTFRFGKHKGLTYEEVKHIDPGYILWCHENIEWFEVGCDEVDVLERLRDSPHFHLDDWEWEDRIWIDYPD